MTEPVSATTVAGPKLVSKMVSAHNIKTVNNKSYNFLHENKPIISS